MKYEPISQNGQYPYPANDVNPKQKGKDWCMQYAKAAWYDFFYVYGKGVLSGNRGDYDKYRMYALGKQSISQYQDWLNPNKGIKETWKNLDWSIRSIVSLYRDKAISKMMKHDYDIVATPTDITAHTETQDYYNKLKSKLTVRKLMLQQNPELASHPLISLQSGEPLDIEEMEMRVELGEQFNRAKDAELAIDLGFYENDYKVVRRQFYEDLFDWGITAYEEWLGDDNKAKFKRVDSRFIISSYSVDGTFRDIQYAGVVDKVPLTKLATLTGDDGNNLFSEEELETLAQNIKGNKFGNPNMLGMTGSNIKRYDKFNADVLNIYFYTWDEMNFRDRKDKFGNAVFREEEYGRGSADNPTYKKKRVQYVYKCKWVVGTDICYDYGKCYDQKRDVKETKKALTRLPIQICAYNFHEMKAQGFMERLIPYLDDLQRTYLQINNFKNRAVPSGWWIDMDALVNTAMKKNGKDMSPQELLKMFLEMGVMVGTSKDAAGNPQNPNWKPIIPISNTVMEELQGFYNDIINTIQTIEKITGFNDVTMGQANSKTLVPGYEVGAESTEDALYPMMFAEQFLSTRLAEDVLCRMQQGLKKGEVSGYAPALNTNILQMIKLDAGLALRDYGIQLEKRSTKEERMWLMQNMQADIQNELLDSSDAVYLINTKNVKQAQMIWSYRVKAAKEKRQQYEMQKIQEQNQGTQQAAKIAQEGAIQQKRMEYQFELQKERLRISGELQKEQMRVESQERIAMASNQTKIAVAQETGDSKVVSTDIAGQHQQAKQHLANQKESVSLS